MMRDLRFATAVLAIAVLLSSCSHSGPTYDAPRDQENFGVKMAQMNLWREAMFRFQRAVETSPGDAMAHSNLAVAYEANGDFEKARREYLEALKLDKGNQYIQKNYSRFVEFTSRNKKRTPAKAAASSTPAAASTTQAPPVVATSTQPPSNPAVPPDNATPPPVAPGLPQPAAPNPPVPPHGGV